MITRYLRRNECTVISHILQPVIVTRRAITVRALGKLPHCSVAGTADPLDVIARVIASDQ